MRWWISGAPNEKLDIQAGSSRGEPVTCISHLSMQAEFVAEQFSAPFDYVRIRIAAGQNSFPLNYQGVSGGGVWIIPVTIDPKIGVSSKEFASPILAGVAFYQSEIQDASRVITLHGPRSVWQTVSKVVLGDAN
jgi:hypothetical protein